MPHVDFVFGEYDGHVGFCCPHLHLQVGPGYYVMTLDDFLCGGKYKLIACERCKSDPGLPLQLAAMIRKNKAELDKFMATAGPGDGTPRPKKVFSQHGMHVESDKPTMIDN